MFWTDNTNRVAGVLIFLFLVLTVISVFTSFSYMNANPFDRSEVDEFLTDVNDNEAMAIVSVGFDNAANVVALLLAAALYLVFRGRDRPLALFAFAGLFAAAVASLGVAAGQETVIILADDFANGGVGELEAGSDVTVEVARAVAMSSFILDQIAATAMGAGLLALGALIAWAPAAAGATPPRWIGWVAGIAGLANILTWLGVAAEPFFVFFPISGLALLISFIALGVWLVRTPEEAAPMEAPRGLPQSA